VDLLPLHDTDLTIDTGAVTADEAARLLAAAASA